MTVTGQATYGLKKILVDCVIVDSLVDSLAKTWDSRAASKLIAFFS